MFFFLSNILFGLWLYLIFSLRSNLRSPCFNEGTKFFEKIKKMFVHKPFVDVWEINRETAFKNKYIYIIAAFEPVKILPDA